MILEFVFRFNIKSEIQSAAFQGKTAESYANVTLILRLSYATFILLSRGSLSSGKISGCVEIELI